MAFEAGHKLAPGGARPGAGRKSDALKLELQRLLDAAVDEETWGKIFAKLAERAAKGDLKAMAMLLDRKFGKAPQVIEIEEPEGAHLDLNKMSQEDLETVAAIFRKASVVPGAIEPVPDASADRGGTPQTAL